MNMWSIRTITVKLISPTEHNHAQTCTDCIDDKPSCGILLGRYAGSQNEISCENVINSSTWCIFTLVRTILLVRKED